ncbi:MAG: hypothetical protein CME29_01835 [Gemmatimonadetes bacterium]|nr:hypothetical protein [Gemmatimonadota bacterium]|tara:strand:- start:272056 stop:272715 length:660 start_codon:yes stop_codon:yes gene_type:complete
MTKMRHWIVWLILSQVSATPVKAQDIQAYDVLAGASLNYSNVDNFCAQFHQIIEVTLLNQARSGHGRMCQRQPDEFAMRFSEPAGDLVVVDGESVWTFYPSMDKQQVLKFSGLNSDGRFNFYKNLLTNPRDRFRAFHQGIEAIDSNRAHKILMEPKEDQGFRFAVVWIDIESELIIKIEVHDSNESIRTIMLTDIQLDAEIADDEFRFIPPAGARVIIR